jgi:hypothetical protein
MEINALTVYLALGIVCALAMWAEDFENRRDTFNVWEYVLIITLGPALAAINLILLVCERIKNRKQRG